MKDRLLELRNRLNLNQVDFGEKIGLSKASISALEGGMRNITDRHIMLLTSNLNVNEDWLRTGNGEMFIENDSTIIADLSNEYNLSEFDKKIIEHYVNLDEKSRQAIKKEVVSLAEVIISMEESAAAKADDNKDIEDELERTRLELEAEKKGKHCQYQTI